MLVLFGGCRGNRGFYKKSVGWGLRIVRKRWRFLGAELHSDLRRGDMVGVVVVSLGWGEGVVVFRGLKNGKEVQPE